MASAERATRPIRDFARTHPADIVDVFVYVVVLNLAIQYFPAVISENFTLSLLTAILLKLVLEIVLRLKARVMRSLKSARSRRGRVIAGLGLWAVAAGSKFVVIELVALVFGDAVSLGNFFSVTGLVIVLLLSRNAVRRLIGEPVA